MHVLQWITVQADDKDMAFRTVKDTLETELGSSEIHNAWFDWFVVGGGRWNPNPDSQYDDNDQSMVLSYDEDSQAFLNQVELSIQSRIDEFNRYRKEFNESNIDISTELDKYAGNTDYSFGLYPLSKLIDMLHGKWKFTSYYYDVHHGSTNREHMLSSIDNGNKNWYAVPVDFHF